MMRASLVGLVLLASRVANAQEVVPPPPPPQQETEAAEAAPPPPVPPATEGTRQASPEEDAAPVAPPAPTEQELGPRSELPYYIPAPSEELPPPPEPPPPPGPPAKPTLTAGIGPLVRTHYMLNEFDFTYVELGVVARFGAAGQGVSMTYVTAMDGILFGYETPNFFGIKLYDGVVDLSLSGPKAVAQLGGADIALPLGFGFGERGAMVVSIGTTPIGLIATGCEGIPFYAQLGPQLAATAAVPFGSADAEGWLSTGVSFEAGILFF